MVNPRRRLPAASSPQRSSPWTYSVVTFVAGVVVGHFHAQFSHSAMETLVETTTGSVVVGNEPNLPTFDRTTTTRNDDDGWHSIHVFYGAKDHLAVNSSQQWFSQCRQDELVVALLQGKRNGYFLDLAANDATTLSNTYALERDYGWTGLCIEPNPIYWANLTYRDCQIVGAVVGNKRMEQVRFRFDAGDKSGIVGDGFYNGKQFERAATPRYTVSLEEVLERYQVPRQIDYLSLDVEGAEEFIMKSFPLDAYNISIITVEKPLEPLRNHLEQNGYKHVMRFSRWGETLYVHESLQVGKEIMDEFDPKKQKVAH